MPDNSTCDESRIAVLDHRSEPTAEEICDVLVSAYRIEAAIIGASDFPPLRRTASQIRGSATTFYGLVERGRIAGVIEVDRLGARAIHIDSLAVRPEFFRRGVATRLVCHVIALPHAERVTVSTGATNDPAITLYETCGFGRRDASVIDGIAVVALELERRTT